MLVLNALLVVSYSLGSGNVGTPHRHRVPALPLLLLFRAAGLDLKRRTRTPAGIAL